MDARARNLVTDGEAFKVLTRCIHRTWINHGVAAVRRITDRILKMARRKTSAMLASGASDSLPPLHDALARREVHARRRTDHIRDALIGIRPETVAVCDGPDVLASIPTSAGMAVSYKRYVPWHIGYPDQARQMPIDSMAAGDQPRPSRMRKRTRHGLKLRVYVCCVAMQSSSAPAACAIRSRRGWSELVSRLGLVAYVASTRLGSRHASHGDDGGGDSRRYPQRVVQWGFRSCSLPSSRCFRRVLSARPASDHGLRHLEDSCRAPRARDAYRRALRGLAELDIVARARR